MSELRNRMIQDLRLAGLKHGTADVYLRAVRQLAAYYMTAPDRISERQVQDYLLYVRDDLGVAKGTFEPMLAGLKFFYVNTLGYEWPLLTIIFTAWQPCRPNSTTPSGATRSSSTAS